MPYPGAPPWQNHAKIAMAPDWTRGGRAKRGPPVSSALPWQLLRDFAMGGAWVGQKYTQPPSRTIQGCNNADYTGELRV